MVSDKAPRGVCIWEARHVLHDLGGVDHRRVPSTNCCNTFRQHSGNCNWSLYFQFLLAHYHSCEWEYIYIYIIYIYYYILIRVYACCFMQAITPINSRIIHGSCQFHCKVCFNSAEWCPPNTHGRETTKPSTVDRSTMKAEAMIS